MRLAIVCILLVLAYPAAADVIDVIEEYYSAFKDEDFDRYTATQYLENPEDKKLGLQNYWASYDTLAYSIDEFSIERTESVAIASFNVHFIISNDAEQIEENLRLSAVLVKENEWKILDVKPAELLQQELKHMLANSEPVLVEGIEPAEQCGDGRCELGEECEADCKLIEYQPDVLKAEDESLAAITVCEFPRVHLEMTTEIPDEALEQLPYWVQSAISKETIVKILIDGEEFTMSITGNKIIPIVSDEYDYLVSVNSCTIEQIVKGDLDPLVALDSGLIDIQAQKTKNKVKLWLGKVALSIASWFRPTPKEFIVEAETGLLKSAGRYSFVGPTSRGPGELYLGTGGSYAEYEFESPFKGRAELWVKVSDDKMHKDGARSVDIILNSQEIKYQHKSIDYTSDGSIWGWEKVGDVELDGQNKMKILKPQQTSAAFVMDSFKLVKS